MIVKPESKLQSQVSPSPDSPYSPIVKAVHIMQWFHPKSSFKTNNEHIFIAPSTLIWIQRLTDCTFPVVILHNTVYLLSFKLPQVLGSAQVLFTSSNFDPNSLVVMFSWIFSVFHYIYFVEWQNTNDQKRLFLHTDSKKKADVYINRCLWQRHRMDSFRRI